MYCEGKLKFKSHNTSYYLYCPLYKNLRNKYIINEEFQSDLDEIYLISRILNPVNVKSSSILASLGMVSLCNMSCVWCY